MKNQACQFVNQWIDPALIVVSIIMLATVIYAYRKSKKEKEEVSDSIETSEENSTSDEVKS